MVLPPVITYSRRAPRWYGPLLAIVGAAAVAVATSLGYWWSPAVVGLLFGLLLGGWRAATWATIGGIVGWGVLLPLDAARTAVLPKTARVVAGIVGIDPRLGWVVLLATVLLAGLLGASGAWAGVALRALVATPASPRQSRQAPRH